MGIFCSFNPVEEGVWESALCILAKIEKNEYLTAKFSLKV